jgi:hypothetical protein
MLKKNAIEEHKSKVPPGTSTPAKKKVAEPRIETLTVTDISSQNS